MTTKTSPPTPAYPATLTIDYPDRSLNRLTTFFRIFTVIPIAIILALVSGGSGSWDWGAAVSYTHLTLPTTPYV